jgi:lysophospholipase L1-like esterase
MSPTALTIVAFGDSITLANEQPAEKRWPLLLEASLRAQLAPRSVRVVNAGVGGNTSREGLARIETDVIRHQPDIVAVEFGGNDTTVDQARHVTLGEYRANLEAIRRRLTSEGRTRVVLVTFPPLVDAWHAWGNHEFYRPHGGLDRFVERYRTVTRTFARDYACPLADIDAVLRQAMARDGNGHHILPDGVHLTAAGNAVVAAEVLRALTPLLA